MAKEGATIKEIVRSAGHSSRLLVRKGLSRSRGRTSSAFAAVRSKPYLPWLDQQWADRGRRNGSELWRSLKQRGFRGCLRVVSEWSGRRRRSERMDASAAHHPRNGQRGRDDQGDRAKRRPQPRLARKVLRGQCSSIFRVRSSSLEADLPGSTNKLVGGGPAQRLRAMALPEAARVSRVSSRRQRVERATTAIGKDGVVTASEAW